MVLCDKETKVIICWVSRLFTHYLELVSTECEKPLEHTREKLLNIVLFDGEADPCRVNRSLDIASFVLVFADSDWLHDQLGAVAEFDLWVRLSLNYFRRLEPKIETCVKSIPDGLKVILMCLCHLI